MKKFLSIICSILTFIIMLPITFIIANIMLLWYQGIGFNGIFQLFIIIILCVGLSISAAIQIYKKIMEYKNE